MLCPKGHEAWLRSPDYGYGHGSEWVCYSCHVYGYVFSSNHPGVNGAAASAASDAARATSKANADAMRKGDL